MPAEHDPPGKELDRLYGLPLDEFTRARNELARKLRADGRREAAEAARRLKKPNLAAWAVNQLVRRHRKDVRRLLEAGRRLRDAHQRLLAGEERGSLSKAAERERELVSDLVQRAEPLLSEAGSPTAANLERIRSTLHAAALDEGLRQELEAGRVVSDREAVGLGPSSPAGARAKPARKAGKKKLREARQRSRQAEERLQAAERSLERARIEAEEARRGLVRHERTAELARAEAEEARAAEEQARRAAED